MSHDITSANKGRTLILLARASIAEALGHSYQPEENLPLDVAWLQDQAACFITLKQHGQLRGCIGTLEAYRSLLDDVTANARAAAFKDSRFLPLQSHEFSRTLIEVSLLSAMQKIYFSDEQHALEQLRPGIDGLVFEYGSHRSTFLPQVWEQLPERDDFIAALKQKAGIATNFWADTVKLSRYTVSKWKEDEFKASTETAPADVKQTEVDLSEK